MKTILVMLVSVLSIEQLFACNIIDKKKTSLPGDGLYALLKASPSCPKDVLALKRELQKNDWRISSFMVANRGRLNPTLGSFSFFEVANMPGSSNEIFFGHFTDVADGHIILDQSPSPNKLLIEAIAFDEKKGLYNFYELIGQENDASWFYRGDSRDALLDNAYLYRTPPLGVEKFGKRMRCSACHNSGGPIMKELASPHNDWWRLDRSLIFAHPFSAVVDTQIKNLSDALMLSKAVRSGMNKLYESPTYQKEIKERELQEILRPLFCTTEINLVSSVTRLNDEQDQFLLPPEFVLHPLLGAPTLAFKKANYEELLKKYRLKFPETKEKDADHIWLSLAPSFAELKAVELLINQGVISQKMASDILMVDFRKPILSEVRCGLLKLLPENQADWLDIFIKNLKSAKDPEARKLADSLLDERSFFSIHMPILAQYAQSLEQESALEPLFKTLLETREQVFSSELSKNPLGQILEPGFRVIFPSTKS